MSQKLSDLEAEFLTHHHAVIDLINDDETLAKEQEILDTHDDTVAEFSVRIKQVIVASSPSVSESSRKIATSKLAHLQKSLASISSTVDDLPTSPSERCLLKQYEEKMIDLNKDFTKVRDDLHQMELEETDKLFGLQDTLECQVFDCSVKIKKLLSPACAPSEASSASSESKGVRLPKLDVPTFSGNILNWTSFWEQFRISVHDRTSLSDSEKLVYLQQSLKGGTAKTTIEGLSRSGENYSEAIKCLQSRYDRPRLIHKAHVRMILEAPSLKEGSGRELQRLHDTVQQHLRALKTMDCEPPGPFVTSILELKLDSNTMFEWQKHTQESATVPHYNELLGFINLHAQASESLPSSKKQNTTTKPVASFTAGASDAAPNCVLCKTDRHPLYACPRFKSLSHDEKISTVKLNGVCINCLKPGHFLKQCKSLHRCRTCQKPHHSLLHIDNTPTSNASTPQTNSLVVPRVTSNASGDLSRNTLMMTCMVLVEAPDGSTVKARALLDSASSASFVSERLVKGPCLPRLHQNTTISGIAGLTRNALQAIANLTISSTQTGRKFNLTAIVVPRVTCDLPVKPVSFGPNWNHLNGLSLADPDFGRPGRIDLLLGVDIFIEALLHGRRAGSTGTPVAFETVFGWVLAGPTDQLSPETCIATHHALVATGDDLLRKFWEIEESTKHESNLSPEEKFVVQHFDENHCRTPNGRFIVPLPKKPHAPPLGESRTLAVRRFLCLERSLRAKGEFDAVESVIKEYFVLKHAEPVPTADLDAPPGSVFYLPMHVVKKESSTTTKIRAVFDASAKSSSNVSLNDILLVGPTVHSSLINVLLRFRLYRVAL